MKLLHIDSSSTREASASRQLSAAIVTAFQRVVPGLEVVRRDLDAEPIPHLDSRLLPTIRPGNAPEGATGVPDEKGADALEEFLAADIVVIGAPMYNFTIPSQLKAWIDRIVIAGKTFRYTESGSIGLAGGKRVIIASSRGGLYARRACLTRPMTFRNRTCTRSLPSWGYSASRFYGPRALLWDHSNVGRRCEPRCRP
jgi:FMN-dependent NADH-azoreductase